MPARSSPCELAPRLSTSSLSLVIFPVHLFLASLQAPSSQDYTDHHGSKHIQSSMAPFSDGLFEHVLSICPYLFDDVQIGSIADEDNLSSSRDSFFGSIDKYCKDTYTVATLVYLNLQIHPLMVSGPQSLSGSRTNKSPANVRP